MYCRKQMVTATMQSEYVLSNIRTVVERQGMRVPLLLIDGKQKEKSGRKKDYQ